MGRKVPPDEHPKIFLSTGIQIISVIEPNIQVMYDNIKKGHKY